MWWILLAALIAGGNGFFWGLFVQAAITPSVGEVRRPYGRVINLHHSEWKRL